MVNRRNAPSRPESSADTTGDGEARDYVPRVSSRLTATAFVCLVGLAALGSCVGMGGNDGQVERTPAQIYCDPARGVDYADAALPATVNVIRPGRYGLEIRADDLTAPPKVARAGLLGRLGVTMAMPSKDDRFTAVMPDGAVVTARFTPSSGSYNLVVSCDPAKFDRSTAVPASPFPAIPVASTAPAAETVIPGK